MPIWYMADDISEDKKKVVINLYESGIGEEFIAMAARHGYSSSN